VFLDTAGIIQVNQNLLDKSGQKDINRVVIGIVDTIKGRIHGKPAVKVRPSKVIQHVLFRFDAARCDLGVDMIVELVMKRRFDRERFVQEFLVKVFLDIVNKNLGNTVISKLWATLKGV
jgi:hypothetical protein